MRAVVQPGDEPAGRAAGARMLFERGQQIEQTVAEIRNLRRGDVLELTEADVARDYRSEAPIVGPAERANPRDVQFVGIEDRRLDGRNGWLGHGRRGRVQGRSRNPSSDVRMPDG